MYELLIEHFREMLRFYKEKAWKHAFNNIVNPFKLRFEERLKSIGECSQSMSQLANALAHRDDRNAHAMQIDLLNCILELNRSKQRFDSSSNHHADDLTEHYQLSKDNSMVCNDMRVGQMIAAVNSSVFKNPTDILNARLALCRRHASPRGLDISTILRNRNINAWSTKADSALLLIRGSKQLRPHTEFVGTKMVQAVKKEDTPILFAFQSGRGSKQITTTPTQILQYLLEQALKLNADNLEKLVSSNFNATRVSSATTIEQWAQLLSCALCSLPLVYIYVDLDLISGKDTFQDALSDLVQAMQQLWQSCPSTTVKVAFVSHQRTMKLKGIPAQSLTLDIGKMKRR
jgi:hypothetical protein